jgi:putative FmdB family regulatory protein
MPLYEYICEQDGERIELLRPIAQADAPVEDPKRRGRTFKRTHSTFATQGAPTSGPSGKSVSLGGCCPCGKDPGSCRA